MARLDRDIQDGGPVLRILHRAIHTHLIQQTGLKRKEAASGAVTLILRFGSAANLNTHLHAPVLDGVYQSAGEAAPVFMESTVSGNEPLQTLLSKISHSPGFLRNGWYQN